MSNHILRHECPTIYIFLSSKNRCRFQAISSGTKKYNLILTHPEMSQLPSTCKNQDNDLCDTVPDSSRVCQLAEIPKIRFPLSLVLLFPPDILQLLIQITELGREFGNV